MTRDRPDAESVPDLDVRMRALRSRTRREILALVWDRELAAGEIAAAFALARDDLRAPCRPARGRSRPDDPGRDLTSLPGSTRGARRPARRARRRHEVADGDGHPRARAGRHATRPAVVAASTSHVTREAAFEAFVDPDQYSRWLQVPVTIRDGAFAATLEWGTEVRGRYELAVPPQLIVMSWDFEDDNVPVPGSPADGLPADHSTRGRLPGRGPPADRDTRPGRASWRRPGAWCLVG